MQMPTPSSGARDDDERQRMKRIRAVKSGGVRKSGRESLRNGDRESEREHIERAGKRMSAVQGDSAGRWERDFKARRNICYTP